MVWRMALTDAALDEPWIPDDSTFGARLALVRWKLQWNVKEAADACGLNDQSWRNWESGKLPRDIVTTARTIADITGCSEKWLVVGDQNWKDLTPPDLHVLPGGKPTKFDTRPEQQRIPFLTLVRD